MLIHKIKKYLDNNGIIAQVIKDYLVADNGDGQYIYYWNSKALGAKPTDDVLDMIDSDEAAFFVASQPKLAEAKKICEETILAKYPEYKQRNLAIYGTDEEKETFKSFKLSITDKYDEFCACINSCETAEEVDAIEINY